MMMVSVGEKSLVSASSGRLAQVVGVDIANRAPSSVGFGSQIPPLYNVISNFKSIKYFPP